MTNIDSLIVDLNKRTIELNEAIFVFEKHLKEDTFIFSNAHKMNVAQQLAKLDMTCREIKKYYEISDYMYKDEYSCMEQYHGYKEG